MNAFQRRSVARLSTRGAPSVAPGGETAAARRRVSGWGYPFSSAVRVERATEIEVALVAESAVVALAEVDVVLASYETIGD